MKKRLLIALGLFSAVLVLATPVHAQNSEDFVITAEVPTAGKATFVVNKITEGAGAGGADLWEKQTGTDLNLGKLVLDPDNNIFLPVSYYAIDVGSDGAGNNPDISVSYVDDAWPVGSTVKLSNRGTISFAQVIYGQAEPVNIAGMSLGQANGYSVPEQPLGSWLRVSVGVATGSATLDEGDATPFTASDLPGQYIGTLTLSATFDI